MPHKPTATIDRFRLILKSRFDALILNPVLIPLLILGALFLPPVSLAGQVSNPGPQAIEPDCSPIQISDESQIALIPVEVNCLTWDSALSGDSAPSSDGALSGNGASSNDAPGSLSLAGTNEPGPLAALERIPPDLTPVNPIYQLQPRQEPPKKMILTLALPDRAEAQHLLDLYAWNGVAWRWLPHRKISIKKVMEAELDFWPELVALMQTPALAPKAAIDYNPNAPLPDEVRQILAEINPLGFRVGSDGRITGSPGQMPSEIRNSALAVIPTLRNWDSAARPHPVDNLLIEAELQKQHIKAIVDLVRQGGYQGIELDYRGINPELRRELTAFLAALRRALPANKRLSIRVETPQPMLSGTWDTGAYDWLAIGRLADALKVPASPDPKAYPLSSVGASDSSMEAMLDWAVGQVNRSKLQLLFRANSAEQIDRLIHDITYQQALEQLGEVALVTIPSKINPGQSVDFTLAALPTSTGIQVDEASGTYWFAYLDTDNRHHTVYLENSAVIVPVLQLATRYHLQGVAIQSLADNNERIWEAARVFKTQTAAPDQTQYSVVWQVQRQDGRLVSEETVDLSSLVYGWTAPAGGAYEIAASIASNQAQATVSRGSMVVSVATPAPKPQPAQPSAPPRPPGPTPPAVPPVNVSFGYGIQADPRGDIGVNIGHIKTLGFGWVKFQMSWKDVESNPGNYNWGPWDQLVDAFHANGIQILLSIPKSPDWARPVDDDKSVEGPPQDLNLYAAFVANVAGRYRGRVQAIEIWNEQNLWYEAGGMGRISAANYVQMLQLSYIAIKAVNPEMIVVSGGLTPAGNVGEAAVDDIDYLRQMYAQGAQGFFDALGAHPSGYNCPAKADWRVVSDSTAVNFRGTFDNRHHSWCFRGTLEGYREVMVANGDGDKKIIPTEFGWAADNKPKPGYEYAQDNTYEEQAQWIVEAFQQGKEWGWVGSMFLWNLDYGITAPGTELASFGIINRPAYDALVGLPK
jgi:spore germination protein YaaH